MKLRKKQEREKRGEEASLKFWTEEVEGTTLSRAHRMRRFKFQEIFKWCFAPRQGRPQWCVWNLQLCLTTSGACKRKNKPLDKGDWNSRPKRSGQGAEASPRTLKRNIATRSWETRSRTLSDNSEHPLNWHRSTKNFWDYSIGKLHRIIGSILGGL